MVLRNFEDRLERMVEGVFARAFKSGLQPVELARRLVREIDTSRTVDVRGRALAPNRFIVRLSPDDSARFAQVEGSLLTELIATIRDYAKEQHLGFLGRVSVELQTDPTLRVGLFRVHPSYDDTIGGGEADAWLEGTDGTRFTLKSGISTIGRLSESDIVINDQNVSREHGEIHPVGDAYQLVDLGSTNGCKINGQRIERQILQDNDQLTFGPVSLRFRQLSN